MLINSKARNFIIIGFSQLVNLFSLIALLPYIKGSMAVYDYNNLVLTIVILQGMLCFNPISNVFLRGLSREEVSLDDVHSLNFFILVFLYCPILFLWLLAYKLGFNEHVYIFYILMLLVLIKLFFERSILVYCDNVSIAVLKVAIFQVAPIVGIIIYPIMDIYLMYVIFFTMFFFTTKFNINWSRLYNTVSFLADNIKYEIIFSLTSLAQSNADKYFIPILFSKAELTNYFLAIMIPSRLIAIYSNISNIYSKDIFKYKDILFFNKYLKYSAPTYFLLFFILLLFSDYLVIDYLGLDESYKYIFYLSLFTSGIQIFGFINYQYFSAFNMINKYTILNVVAFIVFVVSIYTLHEILSIGIISIPVSLMLSKILEPIGSVIVIFLTKKRSLK